MLPPSQRIHLASPHRYLHHEERIPPRAPRADRLGADVRCRSKLCHSADLAAGRRKFDPGSGRTYGAESRSLVAVTVAPPPPPPERVVLFLAREANKTVEVSGPAAVGGRSSSRRSHRPRPAEWKLCECMLGLAGHMPAVSVMLCAHLARNSIYSGSNAKQLPSV